MKSLDRGKSIEQLEREFWPPLKEYPTRLVERCHLLRKVPVGELSTEDLRLLIGQNIGTVHLMPLAIEILREDPLAEGAFYLGDLLKSALGVPESYWDNHSDQKTEILRLAEPVRDWLTK